MKILKYITTVILTAFIFFSCNEEEWLKEEAYDFYSADNSFVTAEQFNSGVAKLYQLFGDYTTMSNAAGSFIFMYTSDLAYNAIAPNNSLNSYIDKIVPSNANTRNLWRNYYQIIYDANVIINRIDGEDTEFDSEEQRNILKAEAMFFRGDCYRLLGIMYGGVPLVLEEITAPKRDFVRATREEVLAQAISDVEFAAANLPNVDEITEDGRLTKAAANHLLTELYVTAEEWDKAIAAASSVINDPNYELMTTRFGARKDEPGDVYWDMFRIGNQNRKTSVNKEAIWVCQFDYNVTGGGRFNNYPQYSIPFYASLTGKDGKTLFNYPNAAYGGRGIGWFVVNNFMINEVWADDPTDMRCSEYNIYKDIKATNPASAYYGMNIVESDAFLPSKNLYNRNWAAIMVKIAPVNELPDEYYIDKETGATINTGPWTFRDHYFMRLAETYLLRAEAYLGKGDKTNAAADINVVRARANATPVAAGNVDIDYILDERARELVYEEYRTVTLMRTKKLAERVKKYNPMYNGLYATNGVEEYHNLYPIPADEIENNSEAVLEQNPGYN
jgi:hypothetical protein